MIRDGTSMERGGQGEDGGSLPQPCSCMLPFCYSWLHGEVKSPKVNGALFFISACPSLSLHARAPSLYICIYNNRPEEGPLHYFWTHTLQYSVSTDEQRRHLAASTLSPLLSSLALSFLALAACEAVTRPGPGDQAGDRACAYPGLE